MPDFSFVSQSGLGESLERRAQFDCVVTPDSRLVAKQNLRWLQVSCFHLLRLAPSSEASEKTDCLERNVVVEPFSSRTKIVAEQQRKSKLTIWRSSLWSVLSWCGAA